MKSSNNINRDTFTVAVAELAAQVEGPDGHWQPAPLLDEAAACIVTRVDGVPSGQHVDALVLAAKLKHLWDSITDRDPSRTFDVIVGKLAGYAPSKAPEQVHAFATKLVEHADGTEFADDWRVWALKQAAALKNAWTPKVAEPIVAYDSWEQGYLDLFRDMTESRLQTFENDFYGAYRAGRQLFRVREWMKGALTADEFLETIGLIADTEYELVRVGCMDELERREWLDSAGDGELTNTKSDLWRIIMSKITCLSGQHDAKGNLHTYMLPWAVELMLARRHAPVSQQLALAA
jgi:hypothetical protein